MYAFFERLLAPFPPLSNVTPPSKLSEFCRFYSKGVERYLVLMALATALMAIMEASLFGFLGQLVDWLAMREPEKLQRIDFLTLAFWAGVLLILLPAAVFIQSTMIHQVLLGNYPMRARWLMHGYLLDQSMAFFSNEFAGRISTKVMQTALAVRETVIKLLNVLLYVTIYFFTMVFFVAQADALMMLPLLLWLVAYMCTLKYFIPKLREISTRQADARASMTGRIVDSYTNMMTVKLFSHSKREAQYAQESMQSFLQSVHPQMRLATSLQMCIWLLNACLIFSLTALAIYLWYFSRMTPGGIAIAVGLGLRLNGMSHWVMWEISALFENVGTVKDGMNTIALPHDVQDIDTAKPLNIQQGQIDFQNIVFDYDAVQNKLHNKPQGNHQDDLQQPALFDGLNMTIHPGEKVGIVGRSGAGKSTLVNLLLRFYDLQSGTILIDGQSVAEVQQDSLREKISMVTQEPGLMHRSIRDNLLYGHSDASEEGMILAAQQAQAHDFIMQLKDTEGRTGYDAHVGERGVKLSGGQRQRIAIARVILKNAPILILDEATSALDSEVESIIQQHFSELMQDKTVIAIAHRLSTIAALDRLIVLDGGRVIESGTHDHLIRTGGSYAQLWQRQSGGFLGQ